MQARFDLLMGLRNAANKLDTALNRAIDARAALQKDVRTSSSGASAAEPQIARLTTDINDLVNLHIQSGEGSLVFRNHLRSWLFRINSRIDRNYLPLTSGMIGVAHMYIEQAGQGAARLQADLTATKVATAN